MVSRMLRVIFERRHTTGAICRLHEGLVSKGCSISGKVLLIAIHGGPLDRWAALEQSFLALQRPEQPQIRHREGKAVLKLIERPPMGARQFTLKPQQSVL